MFIDKRESEQVVTVELGHEQLATLLTQLDAAQQQLDALSSAPPPLSSSSTPKCRLLLLVCPPIPLLFPSTLWSAT